MKYGIAILILAAASFISCDSRTTAPSDQIPENSTPSVVSELTKDIEQDPSNADAYYARARYNYKAGNFADAIYDLAEAMKIDSINEDYHLLLADVHLGSYDSELALKTLDRARRLFPDSEKTLLKTAEIQIILKRYPEAASSLQRILENSPQNIEALQLLGILFKEQGNIEQAANSFQTVVELDGDNYEAWTMLGNLLDIQGDPMALQCFENAIAIDSTYSQGWHSKAFYLQNNGQIDEALDIYKKIHEIDSTYADAYLNAGILFLEKGAFEDAEAEFEALREMNPFNPMAPYYLGVVQEEQGNQEEALGYYNQAASLSPRNVRFGEAVERLRIALGK